MSGRAHAVKEPNASNAVPVIPKRQSLATGSDLDNYWVGQNHGVPRYGIRNPFINLTIHRKHILCSTVFFKQAYNSRVIITDIKPHCTIESGHFSTVDKALVDKTG